MGKLKGLRKDLAKIHKIIEETFEKVDPDLWVSESRD